MPNYFKLPLGAAVRASELTDARVAYTLKNYHFSSLTATFEMKMPILHPQASVYDFSKSDAIVNFAIDHDMRVRGHTLVWHQQVPTWMQAMTPAQVEAAVQSHVQTVMGRYAGHVDQWDVVNEALKDGGTLRTDSFWYQRLGANYVDKAFQWARAADPSVKLFYNEYSAEGVGTKSDAVYVFVRDLRDLGIPIDGVGLQTHADLFYPGNRTQLTSNITRLRNLGLGVEITELDVRYGAGTLAQQAERYGAITNAALDGGCSGITTWGVNDGVEDGWLFDANFNPKPAYWVVHDLLKV